jgi:hypothetical protein
MKNIILFTFTGLLLLSYFQENCIVGNLSSAYAQQDWKQEYADVCAKTQNAVTLSSEELKNYIDRCDKLQERFDEPEGSLGASERKVYTKRLKMCRDIYDFALKYKDNKE